MLWFDKHARFRNRLSPYLDGELTADDSSALESHLEGCDSCCLELDGLRAGVMELRALPEADVPRSFALTPEQVGRPLRQSAPLASPVALRFAGAALTFALAVVLVADFGGGANNGDESADGLQRAASTLGETQNLDQDSAGADAPAASRAPAESDPAAESLRAAEDSSKSCPPADGGGADGAGENATPLVEAPSPQPAPTTGSDGAGEAGAGPAPAANDACLLAGTAQDSRAETADVTSQAFESIDELEEAAQDDLRARNEAIAAAEDDGGIPTLRVVEIALFAALLVVAAALTAMTLSARRRL